MHAFLLEIAEHGNLGPRSAMFEVHRSESGQFVLLHRATGTVVISDEIAAGFETLTAKVRGAREVAAPIVEPPASRGWKAALPWLLAIGLPFVWLIALHLSLAQLASELVIGIRSPPAKGVPVSRKEYDDLRLEVARVESRITKEPRKPAAAAAVEEDDEADEDDDKAAPPTPAPAPASALPLPEKAEAPAKAPTKAPAKGAP